MIKGECPSSQALYWKWEDWETQCQVSTGTSVACIYKYVCESVQILTLVGPKLPW